MNNKTQPTPVTPEQKFPPLPEHDVEEWSESGITLRYVGWSEEKVKAYAEAVRKQALEEAIAICNAICDPHNTDHGNGYNRAALDCEKKIKELLND